MTIAIFTEPEVTNCFSKIAVVIIRENKTKAKICDSETSTNLAAILKTESRRCRENEVLDQSARAIFDNHHCNFTNVIVISVVEVRELIMIVIIVIVISSRS